MTNEILKMAVAQRGRGTIAQLARKFKVSHTAVCKWLKRVPASRVLSLERELGVSRHELRPDIFGPMPARERHSRQPDPAAHQDTP